MEYWYSFKLIKEPIVDGNGNIINATKRMVFSNRKSKLTYGGEWVCPDLSGYNILLRHQKDNELIIKIDTPITDKDESLVSNRKHGTVNIIVKYNFKDFKVKELSASKAEDDITKWGVWPAVEEVLESGVT